MAENPLFYKKIVPLNRETHRGLRVEPGPARFAFAAGSHLIPAVIDEFAPGGRHLPIVFVPGPAHPTAVFLLGLRPGENLFVKEDGLWKGEYIPAFVRRYPFIIGEVSGAEPIVCIDEDYDGLKSNVGEPLFLESGEDAPVLRNNIQFVNEYMSAAKRTDAFLSDLMALGLFRAITIDLRLDGGDSRTLHGLLTIDLEKFDALSDADFLQLRHKRYLPAIFGHIHSLAGVDRLRPAKSTPDTNATMDSEPASNQSIQ